MTSVRNIHHFAMTVPDIDAAQAFYNQAGLQTFERDGTLVVRCFGRDQDQVILSEDGKRKRFHYVSYNTDAESLAVMKSRLARNGVKEVDPPKNVPADGVWFRDFDDMLTNVRAVEDAPWDTTERVTYNTPSNRQARKGRTELIDESMIRPRRLGHIVLFSTDPSRKVAMYSDLFNLRLSDRVASLLSFLHSADGSDHHIVAFAKSSTYGLQHAGFDAGTSDEVAAAARRMLNNGFIGSWGPGRHFVGSNTFAYIRDPWNSLFEFFADMDYIAPGDNWEPRDWEETGTRSIWGDSQTLDFATNFEAFGMR